MKIAIKEPRKPVQIIETAERYRSDCVKAFTGKDNRAEFVRLDGDTFCLGVNEDTLPLSLPFNFYIATTSPVFPIQKIVGTVVFVRTKPVDIFAEEIWDYEVDNLRCEDIEHINKMLNDEYQRELDILFPKNQPTHHFITF